MHKLFILADINSGHSRKWIVGLAQKGFEIGVFSLSASRNNWHAEYKNVQVFNAINFPQDKFYSRTFSKLSYLKVLPYLKKVVKQFKPDLVHAHYATSYGLLGALLNFRPFLISAWGSDVLEFPKKSLFHRAMLKYNLSKADQILSTSNYLADEIARYTGKQITVIPFGVDLELFKPDELHSPDNEGELVIGTVKSLEKKYGIEYLIQAFKIVKDRHPRLSLKLMIVGDGPLRKKLTELATRLRISSHVIFTGSVAFQEVPLYQNLISVYVSLSLNESFGVSALEAAACQKPVVVSAVGGLKEVVANNTTGFVVPSKNTVAAAGAIEALILNENLRKDMGRAGRQRVEELYEWNNCLDQLVSVYTLAF